MQITVTGAAGRFGQFVTNALLEAGHDVRAVDFRLDRHASFNVHVLNMLNREAAYAACDGAEAVVHLANYPDNHYRDAQNLFNENVAMNMNVFQAAAELGVRRLVFASSIQAIAGNRTGSADLDKPSCLAYLPIDGDLPATPGSSYALSKHVGEQMLRYYCDQFDITGFAVRFPFLLRPEWKSYQHRRKSRTLDELSSRTRLDECFTYLPSADAAALVRQCLEAQRLDRSYHCYLPACPDVAGNFDLPELIQQVYPNVPLKVPLDEMTRLVDTSRITAEVGWSPPTPVAEPA